MSKKKKPSRPAGKRQLKTAARAKKPTRIKSAKTGSRAKARGKKPSLASGRPARKAEDNAMKSLIAIMARLRDPQTGCPWDKEQTFASIAPYTIEEAYEVADCIAAQDMAALKEELGDLLFQVVFYAQMGSEAGHFDFNDIAQAIADKMTRRHPHVFGDETVKTAQAQTAAWERHKAEERKAKRRARGHDHHSLLDDVPLALPALTRAEKLQKRAARAGFDWPKTEQVLAKIEEEIGELREEISNHGSLSRQEDEIGDLIFALANLARHIKIDPETALRRTNDKFERRFRFIEEKLRQAGRDIHQSSLEEMESLWQEAKRQERHAAGSKGGKP